MKAITIHQTGGPEVMHLETVPEPKLRNSEVLKEIISHLGLAEESLPRLLNWTVEGYAWMQSGYDILNDLSE